MTLKPFHDAILGLKESLKSQKNLRFHVFAALVVVFAGLLLNISLIEWVILLILIMAVLSSELMNTAIEYTVDMVCPELNEMARKVKDISAAAVFVTAIIAAIIGSIIFVPYFLRLLN